MYRHLLVPVDGTDLSTETVSRAVEFALTLGARITFFHALPDYEASLRGDAEIVRMTAPEDYACRFEGRARELLVKAESAARARGVPCESASTVSDSPYQSIIAAAREAGCDLIFMASHGRRSTIGMMLGSQTLKVLVNSEIPVLVSATANPPVSVQAINTIRDEHRSLAAVLHAWERLFASARSQALRPDAELMKDVVHYIQDFTISLHHPKEEEYLFRKLRERTSEVNADLDELERQHVRDTRQVAELEALVDRYAGGDASAAEVEQGVSRYTQAIWDHMGREEGVILPAAERHLTEQDWVEINDAFRRNGDSDFGGNTGAEFRHLFSRIDKPSPEAPGA
jgi:nucleotide-binding universal stress UspA family protein/hemerythrin-like domain-containing protein